MTALLAFASAALAWAGVALLLPDRPRRAGDGSLGGRIVRFLAKAGGAVRPAGRARAPLDLEARIAAAGAPGGLGSRELMAAKLVAAGLGAVTGALLGGVAPGRLALATTLGGPVAGFLAPDLWLKRRAEARARVARRDLPALLDLLRVTVEAGASLQAALADVGRRSVGPVAAEWRAVAREVELGVPLSRALAGMCARLPLDEVLTLVGALERAARHGAPLADTLAAQARDARLARRRRIQEEAARAGPKIQLVVALLLVPSVLLLVAAALASALIGQDGGLRVT